MVDGCLQNKIARKLLTDKDMLAEYSFIATCPETGLELKCRPDGLLREAGIVLDLKTCLDASYHGFEKTIRNYIRNQSLDKTEAENRMKQLKLFGI